MFKLNNHFLKYLEQREYINKNTFISEISLSLSSNILTKLLAIKKNAKLSKAFCFTENRNL